MKRAAVAHAHHSKRANNKTAGNSLKRAETPETFFPNPTKRNHERQGASPRAEEVHGQAGPPQDQREPRRRGDPPRLRPIHEPRPRRDHRVHQGTNGNELQVESDPRNLISQSDPPVVAIFHTQK